jgi:hypothetical protein
MVGGARIFEGHRNIGIAIVFVVRVAIVLSGTTMGLVQVGLVQMEGGVGGWGVGLADGGDEKPP